MPDTNADKLKRAAAALRKRGFPGDEYAAELLERCEPIATYWAQPYAYPFVPLLESALRLASAALNPESTGETKPGSPAAGISERSGSAEVTPERIATYFLDHCGNCRDAEFYGHAWGHGNPHERHVPVIEDGHGPLSGQRCACKVCVPAEGEAGS